MADMICDNCGQYGIRWVGWRFHNFTHTECPHCGGTNCQRAESEDDEDAARLEADIARKKQVPKGGEAE